MLNFKTQKVLGILLPIYLFTTFEFPKFKDFYPGFLLPRIYFFSILIPETIYWQTPSTWGKKSQDSKTQEFVPNDI